MTIMRKNLPFITILSFLGVLLFCCENNLLGQSRAMVQNVDFYAEGSDLVVKYDIVQAKSGETFEIWLKVITDSGKEYIPASVTGDAGKGVSGGPNKKVLWDVEADGVSLDEEFYVEVFARSEAAPEDKSQTYKDRSQKRGISVGGALALSAVLPGLGRTVVNKGGAQWLLGIVGYGCIAGAVALNNQAVSTYDDYKAATSESDRDDLFQEAESYDIASKVLAGAAITIWVVDLISTGTKAARARRAQSGFSLNYGLDPISGRPLVGFNYRF
jgi:hypothetical protein